jgi:hypothetical protein
MKRITFIISLLILYSCSSTKFVDSWKSQVINKFEPEKLLVVGMTDNLTARIIFEEELRSAFTKRNINAYESSTVFDGAFTNSEKSEEEIDAMKDKLIAEGFDAIAITAIIGVDDRRDFQSGQYYPMGYSWYRFGRYYYRYYKDYRVYHVETSIYNIKEDKDKTLVWVGAFDIVDPSSISATVDDYVERIVRQLEKEGLVDRVD